MQKKKNISLVWITKVILVFTLNRQADRSGWEFALTQYMACTNAMYGIDEKLGYVCLRWITTNKKKSQNKKR